MKFQDTEITLRLPNNYSILYTLKPQTIVQALKLTKVKTLKEAIISTYAIQCQVYSISNNQ